jgi:hypothetical protein
VEENPIKNQLRREKRQDRLPDDAACTTCGCSAPEALTAANRSWLEKHHVVGKANHSDLIAAVCRNCHAILTARAQDVGASMRPPETVLHRFVAIMEALGTFLAFDGETTVAWAKDARRLIAGLDKDCPQWRHMPEAH